MAEVFPESISRSSSATAGEKRVFTILRDSLIPDEDYIVWYEPRLKSKDPDFIIWGQDLGLLVLEVKSWRLDRIRTVSPKKCLVDLGKGLIAVDNPLEQASKAYRELMDKTKGYTCLLHDTGEFRGQPSFPISYCALFTEITRAEAGSALFDGSSLLDVLPSVQCLFADDLDFDPNEKLGRHTFVHKLREAFRSRFNFSPLSERQLKALRHALWPEIRVKAQNPIHRDASEQTTEVLDFVQERIARSIGEGHRLLKGVAGSGKTLVVAARAKYLKKIHPEWRVFVTCYNVATAHYIRSLMSEPSIARQEPEIKVVNFHRLVKELTGEFLGTIWDEEADRRETYDKWETRVGELWVEAVEKGKIAANQCDALLIDEGQDLESTWIRGLTRLLNPETNSLLFCYDQAQNVFNRATPVFKSAGLEVQGKRPVELRTSYRTTQPIMSLATHFAGLEKRRRGDPREDLAGPLDPLPSARSGPVPTLHRFKVFGEMAQFLGTTIPDLIKSQECSWSNVGVLYGCRRSVAFDLAASLKGALGEDRVLWAQEDRESRRNLDISSPQVKMMTFESSKGLEFQVVFVVGLEDLPRGRRDTVSEERIAYVALTRAQERLHILYMRETDIIRRCRAALDRVRAEQE
jgi:hypothetical protein